MAKRWRQVATVQKHGDRYRQLMGLRCCPLSHQAAPHLSPRPDQQPGSALLATHIHLLLFSFLFFSDYHTFHADVFQYFVFNLFQSCRTWNQSAFLSCIFAQRCHKDHININYDTDSYGVHLKSFLLVSCSNKAKHEQQFLKYHFSWRHICFHLHTWNTVKLWLGV